MAIRAFLTVIFLCLTHGSTAAERMPRKLELTVNGVARTAMVFAPATTDTNNAPLVFVWHGHGGGSIQAAASLHIHLAWPEAFVVYPEGLPTAGMTDPQGLKRGWQQTSGTNDDRDLKFFDQLLAFVKRDYSVDAKRVYSTGHSNGAAFTYLLWGARPGLFAAIAPSAGAFRWRDRGTPMPIMHIAGEKDTVVPFNAQKLVMAGIRRVNGCSATPKPWPEPSVEGCSLYSSEKGAPFVSYIHGGDHKYPKEASTLIVQFFKEHTLKQ